ncbi:MAG: hypothetical protein PSX36_11435 [bacterium]|nr:hypothetical protein [bacterium]
MFIIKKIKNYLPFLCALVGGIYFISLTITGRSLSHYPGDLGDGRFNNYLLEHAHQFFTGEVTTFWNAPYMYPEKKVITYSDNLLGSAPFYSAFRLLGNDRERSFQYWYLLMTLFSFASAYIFLMYLFKNNYSAALGAFVFAFSMALQSQVGHAQTIPRFAIPLTFLALLFYFKELRPNYFFLALFLVVYQFYCGIYLGLLLFVPFSLFLVLSFYYKRGIYKLKIRNSRWRIKMISAAILNGVLLIPIMVPYLERAKETGFYPYQTIVESLPTLVSFFYAHNGSLVWQFLNSIPVNFPAFWDHQIFPGGIAMMGMMVFCIIIIFKLRSAKYFQGAEAGTPIFILFFTGLITFLFFLRVDHISLYRLIYSFPGYGSMRALQRIISIELLFFALAVAFVMKLIFKKQRAINALIFLGLLALLISDNYLREGTVHNREVADNKRRVEEVVRKIGQVGANAIISYEPDTVIDDCIHYQLDAMLAAQTLGLRTLNGYSATSPQGYSPYWIKPNKESREAWLRAKKISGKDILVVH